MKITPNLPIVRGPNDRLNGRYVAVMTIDNSSDGKFNFAASDIMTDILPYCIKYVGDNRAKGLDAYAFVWDRAMDQMHRWIGPSKKLEELDQDKVRGFLRNRA